MGTPQKNSFANRVRTAVKDLTARGETCTTAAISIQSLVSTSKDHKRMSTALRDMVKAGELTRIGTGVYALAPKPASNPELRQVMWRLLRMRKAVSPSDLVELANASLGYAAEWLRGLERNGVVRREGDIFRLLKDTVTMPELRDNADKLLALRDKKRHAALAALDAAAQALDRARATIIEL